MHKMTEGNLKNAFAGESQAHMKYMIFADVAEREGKTNIARLFKAIAYAERVHATNHLRVIGDIKDTSGNLDEAVGGEEFEVNEMYPAYLKEAKEQGEAEAEKTNHYALEAEKIHAKMYANAKEAVDRKQDISLDKLYICPVCGYTVEKNIPDFCPVCGAKKTVFKEF